MLFVVAFSLYLFPPFDIMSTYTYATTLQKPTAVHDAIKGNFLGPDETNLIVSKGTRIEIYSFANDMLIPAMELDLYCRIDAIKIYTVPNRTTCSLFVLSKQMAFSALHFDITTKKILTEASGTLLEQKGALPNDEIMTVKDQENQAIIVSAFSGVLSCFPIPDTAPDTAGVVEFEPFEHKIQEGNIKCMVALECVSEVPIFAVLYEQEHGVRLKFYQVQLSRKRISMKYAVSEALESTSHLLVPVPAPYGGVLVIGEYIISYYDLEGNNVAISIDSVVITTCEFIGGGSTPRCLLGDAMGFLYILTLDTTWAQKTSLDMSYLGQVSAFSSAVHLGVDMLYLGSSQGDSYLARLDLKNPASPLEVVDEYPSLAPILDFCVYDLDKQGRQTLVCCSGAYNDGSLRIVQSGVDFVERVTIPISSDIKQVWSLNSGALPDKSQHDILVLSNNLSTRLLFHRGGHSEGLEKLDEFLAFDLDLPTLNAKTLLTGDIIQVTKKGIQLMQPHWEALLSDARWVPPPDVDIEIAAIGQEYCVVSCGLGRLFCIAVDYANGSGSLVETSTVDLGMEGSCLSVVDGGPDDEAYVAVGLWKGTNVRLLRLPTLEIVSTATIPGTAPVNILLQTLEEEDYLFVALGNGKLVHYTLSNDMQLLQPKTITLGTQAVKLYSRGDDGKNGVFAASDRSTIINSVSKRLVYSTVNLKDAKGFAEFNNATWPNSVLVMTEQDMLLGDIDPLRKLHISKLPLDKKMGRRITYHDESQTIALGTCQIKRNYGSWANEDTGGIYIYDAQTYQGQYLFVGTTINLPSQPERSKGRILMYEVTSNRTYRLVEALCVPGVVYCIKPYKNSIIAAVDGFLYYLCAYRPEAAEGDRLTVALKSASNILALDLDTNDDSILVGDLMKSVSLLRLENAYATSMTTVAKDYNENWMTAVKMANQNTFIGAEMFNNLFTFSMKSENGTTYMDVVGEFHVGDLINRRHRGSLADKVDSGGQAEEDRWSIVYVTVNGAIGILAGISEDDYMLLLDVQQNMIKMAAPPTGNMDHSSWRNFDNGIRTGEARGYIDGDLVEKFLAFSPRHQQNLVELLSTFISVEDLQTKIENLAQRP
ncbi:hypothetical protein [Absidia glauca]|uniref:DNA damage-binding protein 1 n=1 Tax=Absidia glauca TaxID=4829 RepID=A0A163ITZ8_ABSGL|nr:hypothetical protein [Absidia glauca]